MWEYRLSDKITNDTSDNNGSESPRKASDVVIDLEQKVDLLTKLVYGNDLHSKLMLDRLNRIASSLEELVRLGRGTSGPANQQTNQVEARTGSGPTRPSFVPASLGDQEGDFPSFRPQTEGDVSSVLIHREEPGFSMSVEKEPVGIRRTARPESYTEQSQNKKLTPVFQKVFDQTGNKMIFMADVEIYRAEDHSLALKTRTTAAGKWQAPLPSGAYVVSIMKRENAGRKRLEYEKMFEVSESDSPIELEAAKLA